MGIRRAVSLLAFFVFVGAIASAGEEPDPVEVAMASGLADGPHFNRCAPLVALGEGAVEPLLAVLADVGTTEGRRILAAQALGRLGGEEVLPALRAILDAEEATDDLRRVTEESLFLLGDTAPVDARIERLLTKYTGIRLARETAWIQTARTYCATGRFSSAARVMGKLLEETENEGTRGSFAYDLACYEALAGNREAALAAATVALASPGVNLAWMARDGDLALIRKDPEFQRRIGERLPPAGLPSMPDPEAEADPRIAEFRAFSELYWDGAYEKHREASNRYWEGYHDWVKAEGRDDGDAALSAWQERMGPEPVDPAREWIPGFQKWVERLEGTPLATQAREELLMIYGNEMMEEEWAGLFLEMVKEDPEHERVGLEAGSALHWFDRLGRQEEMLVLLRGVLREHPAASSAAGIRLALATALRAAGDLTAAREEYREILKLPPDSFYVEEAEGALYEMDHLAPGMPAPEFSKEDMYGEPVSLASFRGKVVLLDFWATWCGPCLGEIPHLKALQAEFGERDDFVLLGVSLDADGIAFVDFLEEEEIGWRQLCVYDGTGDDLERLYNARAIPDCFLLDREGKIVARGLRGEEIIEAVRDLLGR